VSEQIPYEKFFPVVPLIGTTIAVAFDVGYFYGVGINYFTIFSLTEHIGFSLEAIPFALAILVALLLLEALSDLLIDRSLRRAASKLDELSSNDQKKAYLSKRRIGRRLLTLTFFAAGLSYLWFDTSYRAFVLLSTMFVTILVLWTAPNRWYSSQPTFLFLVGTCAAVLLGDWIGSGYISRASNSDTITLKSGEVVAVKLIRAGERGVLFAKPELRSVEFYQWESIKAISHQTNATLLSRTTN
jgi:hypothetical protein